MNRNIIVTGGGGNLGQEVIRKFKREGFKVIAIIRPESGDEIEEADDVYEVDLAVEESVEEFSREYILQYGELDALALLAGGFQGGSIENTPLHLLNRMVKLNFHTAYNMVRAFLPLMKRTKKGTFILVGAKSSLQPNMGKSAVAYSLSKSLLIHLADLISEEASGMGIRAHVFVPSILDTPPNREAMKNQDFSKWVSLTELAEAMHYGVITPSLSNTIFKFYGGI